MLSRDQLLAKVKDLRREEVHVDEWNEKVFVRGFTAYEQQVAQKKGKADDPHTAAWVVCQCVVDASGSRVFNDKDVKTLSETSFRACNQILHVVNRLSGYYDGSLEQAVKNSEPTPSGD